MDQDPTVLGAVKTEQKDSLRPSIPIGSWLWIRL